MDLPESAEIHSHSTVSDGEYRPEKMAELMADHGVELWALTDHDSVDGCQRAAEAAREYGLEFVPGIEISAELQGASIHVLGYGFDPGQQHLEKYGEEMIEARKSRMARMIERMKELGYEVLFEDVLEIAGGGNVGRPHLAKALLDRGYVSEIQEAFDRWLARDKPGYVAMTRPSVPEAAEMIVEAGGLVVLAHPARYGDVEERLPEWREAGLWGLEVRHPSHEISDEERLLGWADEYDLGVTASQDWHGNEAGAVDELGDVRFPDRWLRLFLEALEGTEVGRQK